MDKGKEEKGNTINTIRYRARLHRNDSSQNRLRVTLTQRLEASAVEHATPMC
jgi:hypothetical protein